MQVPHDDHPIWATIRYVFGVVCATVVLWANASDFDMTEAKSILLIALMMGGYEALSAYLRRSVTKE